MRVLAPPSPLAQVDAHDEPGEAIAGPPDFDQLYQQSFAFLWRSLRALGVPRDALDDAAQDVLTVVHRRLAEFQGRASPRTWLFAIARRVAQNYRRTQRRKADPLQPLEGALESPGPSPVSELEARQAVRVVERFCLGLDEERRALFVLGLIERAPAAEIAEAFSIPVNTVYSRLRALRLELKQALEPLEKDP